MNQRVVNQEDTTAVQSSPLRHVSKHQGCSFEKINRCDENSGNKSFRKHPSKYLPRYQSRGRTKYLLWSFSNIPEHHQRRNRMELSLPLYHPFKAPPPTAYSITSSLWFFLNILPGRLGWILRREKERCGKHFPDVQLKLVGWWVGKMERSQGSPSYYSVLGISTDSSIEEIRRAYRKLAMVFSSIWVAVYHFLS